MGLSCWIGTLCGVELADVYLMFSMLQENGKGHPTYIIAG